MQVISSLYCPEATDEPVHCSARLSWDEMRLDSMLLRLHPVIDHPGLWSALQSILHEVVPNDACVVYLKYRDRSKSNTPTILGTPNASKLRKWIEHRHETDLVRSLDLPNVKAKVCQLSDVLFDPRQLEHAEFFRCYMAPGQWHYIARSLFWEGGSLGAEIAIVRTAQQGRFTDHEMAALNRLHPHIEATLQRLMALERRVRGRAARRSPRITNYDASNGRRAALKWPSHDPFEQRLTAAESQLVHLLHAGLSNKEIADRLHKSVRTVKTQLTSVYRKFGVRSRARLLATMLGVAEERGRDRFW